MARPSKSNPNGEQCKYKQTPEVIGKLESAFSIDASVAEACFFANIAESTYYEWCGDSPELSERFKRLRQKPVLKARQVIANDLDNPATAKWYLERKRSQEFATSQDLGIIEKAGLGITINMPEGYSGDKPDTSTG